MAGQVGNFVRGGTAVFKEYYLSVPNNGYAVSNDTFTPAEDGSFSISLYMFTGVQNNSYRPVVCQAGNYNLNAGDRFSIFLYNTYIRAYVASQQANSGDVLVSASFTKSVNMAVDLVVSATNVRLYIDGVLKEEESYTYTPFECNYKVGIGCYTDEDGLSSEPSARDFRILAMNFYDRALTEEEVAANYQNYVSRYSLTE